MVWIEVKTNGIEMPIHELDQLEARLGDVFCYLMGDIIRSDVRINLWHPVQVIGGAFSPMEESVLLDEVMRAIYSVSGPLHQDHEPQVEFMIHPTTEREEVEKQIADHKFQIGERKQALEKYADQPDSLTMLNSEISRLEDELAELTTKLAGMPEDFGDGDGG